LLKSNAKIQVKKIKFKRKIHQSSKHFPHSSHEDGATLIAIFILQRLLILLLNTSLTFYSYETIEAMKQ